MRNSSILALCLSALSSDASADELDYSQALYDEYSVETRDFRIDLDPVNDDVRFAVILRNKETGFERRHEFEGEGANDPSPFQLGEFNYCRTSTIFLTIEFPWRHALPHYVRVLDTFVFRKSDFAFIGMTYGPLTDITLMDVTMEGGMDVHMQPPIGVRCLSDPAGPPFEFFQYRTG